MERFKTSLLAALGLLAVAQTLLLLSSRSADTQSAAAVKRPYQVRVTPTPEGVTILVPRGQIFVIEQVASVLRQPPSGNNYAGDFLLTTIAGGQEGSFKVPASVPFANYYAPSWANTPIRLYADPGSPISVAADRGAEALSVTLCGYLTPRL